MRNVFGSGAALPRLLVAAVLAVVLCACVATVREPGPVVYYGAEVDVAPPPPRVIEYPPPRVGFIWAPGYWEWSGREHVWAEGHWEHERRGYRWSPAHWEQHNGRWRLARGHWER